MQIMVQRAPRAHLRNPYLSFFSSLNVLRKMAVYLFVISVKLCETRNFPRLFWLIYLDFHLMGFITIANFELCLLSVFFTAEKIKYQSKKSKLKQFSESHVC